MALLTFAEENRERIRAVESSFGSAGKPLYQDGRILIGEGKLMKQSRRGQQPKVFFLFSDILVYGSIILNGRWYTKQQIIPLGEKLFSLAKRLYLQGQDVSLLSCLWSDLALQKFLNVFLQLTSQPSCYHFRGRPAG